jgi:anti-anti-sigma factor
MSRSLPVPEAPESLWAAVDGVLSIRSAYDQRSFVIALYGEFDIAGAPEFERTLRAAEATDALELVVDLSGLQFIDSTGISALCAAAARSQADGARLRLFRGPAAVQSVLDLCGVSDHLPFVD